MLTVNQPYSDMPGFMTSPLALRTECGSASNEIHCLCKSSESIRMRWWSISASSDLAIALQHDGNRRAERMQAFDTDVHSRILALVNAILKQNSIAAEVLPDSRLADVGLTSMDMVNLMLGVEAEFDLTIPQCEITPDNFQSIRALEQMLIHQLALGAVVEI